MAYLLLWAESLAVSLLLVATITACTARWRSRGLRALVLVLTLLLGLLPYTGLAVLAGMLYVALPDFAWAFQAALALAGGFLVGAIIIYLRGLRRRGEITRAATWPRGRLALVFLVAVWMHVTTIWIADMSIRQQAGSMRARAAVLTMSVVPPRLAGSDNAALDYMRASMVMGPAEDLPEAWREKWTGSQDANCPDLDANDPQLRAFLRDKAEVLRLLRRGAAKSECRFEYNYYDQTDFGIVGANELAIQKLQQLLWISARLGAVDGDANGAVEDINAMLALAEDTGSCPLTTSMLVGMGCDGLALRAIQDLAGDGKLDSAALARIRFGEGPSWQGRLQRAMVMDEAYRLTVLADVGEGRTTMEDLGELVNVDVVETMAYRLFGLPEDIIANDRVSAGLRKLGLKPYWQAKAGLEELSRQYRRHRGGLITCMLIPMIAHPSLLATEFDARRAVAGTAVAACRYRTAMGTWPGKLDDLVPEYLIVAPIDPFDGKSLRFKSGGDKIVIYSVGPDAVDDGAAAYDRKTETGDIIFELRK